VPEGALLALGNSLPIRTAEVYRPPRAGAHPVWSQRGANGIDGLVCGVAGSLSVWDDPARGEGEALGVLLVGDVSLRHDLGGLATLRHLRGARLLIALVDNGGGRIFDQLPAHALDLGERWRFWSTPDGVSWPELAAAFGLGYREAGDLPAVRAAMREWREASGSTLLRVVVDPDSARRAAGELRRRLGALEPPGAGG
jgi:2-succinyl-5-enolpyruvyl-6-hydroxy-3-cyclohexene-1-carboxylate synthase